MRADTLREGLCPFDFVLCPILLPRHHRQQSGRRHSEQHRHGGAVNWTESDEDSRIVAAEVMTKGTS